jgi:hypothetical protein
MELTEGAYELAQLILKNYKRHNHDHQCGHHKHDQDLKIEEKPLSRSLPQENKDKYSLDYSKWYEI